MANHVHHDLILAWAKGAKIEFKTPGGNWEFTVTPRWHDRGVYRIKPKPKVKKYRFAVQRNDLTNSVTVLYYTDAEFASKRYNNGVRLDWTMVEEEVD